MFYYSIYIFNSELGTVKNIKVESKTKLDAISKFCKACLLPYTLVDQVETELERLVNEVMFESIAHSDWAAPIVVFLIDMCNCKHTPAHASLV